MSWKVYHVHWVFVNVDIVTCDPVLCRGVLSLLTLPVEESMNMKEDKEILILPMQMYNEILLCDARPAALQWR